MMPTLTRYLRTVLVAAGLVVAAMLALAHLVEPHTRPMSEPLDARIIREAGSAGTTDAGVARGEP